MTDEDAKETRGRPQDSDTKSPTDPVRKWTLIILALCAVLLVYYMIADRITPYTTQARVNAVVVPIAPQVSGIVTNVEVKSNQFVEAGDLLFEIDRENYELAVEAAKASLQSARQATGASTASIDAAEAQVVSAKANLLKAEQDVVRLRRIKQEDPGAISDRRVEMSEASYTAAQASVRAAEANLEQARQNLGETGDANFRILQAQANLEKTELDLSRTAVRAPEHGVVTDVRVDRGNFAQAGAPLMTFLTSANIWVQADFTENNLGNIKPGDEVELVFDALPGKVVKGIITQRFSVLVDFELPDAEDRRGIRVGAQASVVVYTGGGFLFNSIAWLKMRLLSILTYIR